MLLRTSRRACGALTLVCAAALTFAWAQGLSEAPEPGVSGDTVVLTGSLRSRDAERLKVPITSNWQLSLQWLIQEGSSVAEGDSIAQFDAGGVTDNFLEAKDSLAQKLEERASAISEDKLQRMELELKVKRVEVDYKKARIDADVPQELMKGKDYRERQIELKRKQKEFKDAQLELLGHEADQYARMTTLEFEISDLRERIERLNEQLESLNVRAPRAGIVVHEDHPWFGRKIRQGDRVGAGYPLARIPNLDTLEVEAWANESAASEIEVGSKVVMALDAVHGRTFRGTVIGLSDAGEPRSLWGKAPYFRTTVRLDDPDKLVMKPGMSVRCEIERSLVAKGRLEAAPTSRPYDETSDEGTK